MKRKKRDFSLRERRLIDGFIGDICRALRLSDQNEDLHQCAWAAFLSVYRSCPSSFSSSSFHGWRRAFLVIWDALSQERRNMDFWFYRQVSLEQPVSDEVPVSRSELLQAPHGDFQDSV